MSTITFSSVFQHRHSVSMTIGGSTRACFVLTDVEEPEYATSSTRHLVGPWRLLIHWVDSPRWISSLLSGTPRWVELYRSSAWHVSTS